MESEISSRDRAEQLEEAVCELLDGKRTPGSGSKSQKGDVKSDLFLAEAKYRSSEDVSVDIEWLETIWVHAQREGKHPLLAVESHTGTRLILIPYPAYHELGGDTAPPGFPAWGRSFQIGRDYVPVTPAIVTCVKIEVPQSEWVILSWGEMLELRRANQPQPKSPPRLRPVSGFQRRPTQWAKPPPWKSRPFR